MSTTDAPAGVNPAKTMLLELWDRLSLDYTPGPLIVYKPGAKQANAVKVNLRLTPEWQVAENGNRFLKSIGGGLFLDMPAASGKDGDGNATWAWQDRATLVTAKLGRKDITWFRYAVPEFRAVERFKPGAGAVPYAMQPKPTAERPVDPDVARRTIYTFHKNQTASTVISYTMDPSGGILQLSTPKHRRSIKLDLWEELDFLEYLAMAHRVFTLMGKR